MLREVRQLLSVVAALGAAGIVVWFAFGRGEQPVSPELSDSGRAQRERSSPGISSELPASRRDAPDLWPPAAVSDEPAEGLVPELDSEELAAAWAAVDLEEVRTALPDNLYWQRARPTSDPQVLAEREAERARWNVEYGKVLSGTASEEEIRAYYDYRARLSGDYVEFATYLIDHFGETLPERDVGLLQLAIRLHRARLEEIPRKLEEAFERKRAQDAARKAWLADEAIFGVGERGAAGD